MDSLYKFKTFELILNSTNELPNKRDFPKLDHGVACNDEYLITYECGQIPEELLPMSTIQTEYNKGSLWKYHLIAGCWEEIKCKNLPKHFKFNSILLSGNLVFLHGGNGPKYSNNSICQTFIGDLSKGNHSGDGIEFEEIPKTNGVPRKGFGQPIAINGQFMYTVNKKSVDNYEIDHAIDVYRLDLSTKKWDVLYQPIGYYIQTNNRLKYEVVYYDKRLYMFSRALIDDHNRSVRCSYMFKKIYVFDLTLNGWQYIDMLPDKSSLKYPENRIYHAWAQGKSQSEYVYMSGGFNEGIFLKDVWRLNLITLEWLNIKYCKLPKPAFFHSLTVTPSGRMYYLDGIIGSCEPGRCCEQFKHLKQNRKIMSVWIQIPKLSAICWDAMLYYFKDKMLELSEMSLKELGLPLEYCKQIMNAKPKI